ncbi:hypothetical protein WJX81_007302 [Elliptochloris bilobata]|uniref:Hemicentin-1-like von Willebrand factor A domain-containing protein n=1 Tax=Elliptochloris bilobata TaxID=381761 RepID=A0AAW1RJP6_9CHLO
MPRWDYSDEPESAERITVCDFTRESEQLRRFLASERADGGGDAAEDVAGGLLAATKLDWEAVTKLVVHFADQPCHSLRYHDPNLLDFYPNGCPSGLVPEELLAQLATSRMSYTFCGLTAATDQMVSVFASAFQHADAAFASAQRGSSTSMEGTNLPRVRKEENCEPEVKGEQFFSKFASTVAAPQSNEDKERQQKTSPRGVVSHGLVNTRVPGPASNAGAPSATVTDDVKHILGRWPKDVPPLHADGSESIDVAFLVDVTGSMGWCIQATKDKISLIMNVMRAEEPDADMRFAFVGYRDHFNGPNRIVMQNFTGNMDVLQAFLQNVHVIPNNDSCEDAAGGLEAALALDWRADMKMVIHFADAPAHGQKYHEGLIHTDQYPLGDPRGLDPEDLVRQLASRGMAYHFASINRTTDKMVAIFKDAYAAGGGIK